MGEKNVGLRRLWLNSHKVPWKEFAFFFSPKKVQSLSKPY
jgi:hypothetical protein